MVLTWEPKVFREKHIRNHFFHHKCDTDCIASNLGLIVRRSNVVREPGLIAPGIFSVIDISREQSCICKRWPCEW